LKYQVSRLSNLIKNTSLNASIESSIINQYNNFNTSNHPIYILNSKLLQKRNNKIFDLQNNDEYIFKNINNKIKIVNKNSLIRRPSLKLPIRRPSPWFNFKISNPNNIWFRKNKTKERMSDVNQEYNIEEMSNNHKNLLNILPIVKILPGQKLEDIKKAAKILANKRLYQTSIIKNQKAQILKKAKISNLKKIFIKKNEIDLNKLLDNLVSVMDYDGVVYICQRNSVRPLSNWATKLNEIIKKNKFNLLTVIPHFYYLDNKFNHVLIFVFDDDFCVILNKENLSPVLDVKSVIGVSFNKNIPDKLNCDDLKVILEQMTRGNVISANKSKLLLKRYKC